MRYTLEYLFYSPVSGLVYIANLVSKRYLVNKRNGCQRGALPNFVHITIYSKTQLTISNDERVFNTCIFHPFFVFTYKIA